MMTTEEWNDKPTGAGRTAMTANPFAALLDGVPRYVNHYGDMEIPDARYVPGTVGDWFKADEVLAALAAAAVPADLAEAGKVLERLRGRPDAIENVDRLRDEAADLITALLARIAAQEAQIVGLEAERNAAIRREETAWREANHANAKVRGWEATVVVRNLPQLSIPVTGWGPGEGEQTAIPHITPERLTDILDKLDAAETALAAERAKVAKLVEAGKRAESIIRNGQPDKITDAADLLRAAITEAGQ